MALEEQLHFDISRCSHCPLGSKRMFCSPAIQPGCHTILVLESPTPLACEENNAWRHPSAIMLNKVLQHAYGTNLSGFHLTFAMKCFAQLEGKSLKSKEKVSWSQICSSHYLEYEIRDLSPERIILFGETVSKLCFPDLEKPWSEMVGQKSNLNPFNIDTYIFESPLSIPARGGLCSEHGLKTIEQLHSILGGKKVMPQTSTAPSLFELLQ